MAVLGIDIGGSKIEYIVLDLSPFRVIDRQRFQTPSKRKEFFSLIDNIVSLAKKEYNVQSIGIGTPGYVLNSQICNSPNLKFLEGFNISHWKKYGNVVVENDANLFTYGEAILGVGKDKRSVFGVTWGTGIGSGFVVDKKIFHVCELGHTVLFPNGKKCSCGKKGHLEAYVGGRSLLAVYNKGRKKKCLDIRTMLKTSRGKALFEDALDYMAIALSNVINLIEPDIIVIGGGVSNVRYIDKMLYKKVKSLTLPRIRFDIKKGLFGDTATIGAALFSNFSTL